MPLDTEVGQGGSVGGKGPIAMKTNEEKYIAPNEWGKAPLKKLPPPNDERWSYRTKEEEWNMQLRVDGYGRIHKSQNFTLSEERKAVLTKTTVAEAEGDKLLAVGFLLSIKGKTFPIAWVNIEEENEALESMAAPVTDVLTRSFGKPAGSFGVDERLNVVLEKNFSMTPKGAELHSISINKVELVTHFGQSKTLLKAGGFASIFGVVIEKEEANFKEVLKRNSDLAEASRKEMQRVRGPGDDTSN